MHLYTQTLVDRMCCAADTQYQNERGLDSRILLAPSRRPEGSFFSSSAMSGSVSASSQYPPSFPLLVKDVCASTHRLSLTRAGLGKRTSSSAYIFRAERPVLEAPQRLLLGQGCAPCLGPVARKAGKVSRRQFAASLMEGRFCQHFIPFFTTIGFSVAA